MPIEQTVPRSGGSRRAPMLLRRVFLGSFDGARGVLIGGAALMALVLVVPEALEWVGAIRPD